MEHLVQCATNAIVRPSPGCGVTLAIRRWPPRHTRAVVRPSPTCLEYADASASCHLTSQHPTLVRRVRSAKLRSQGFDSC